MIDEIQKLPELLNEVHLLIESRKLRFLLTGSSARKLRRGGVNLLGGRARIQHLHPFSWKELGESFDLQRALSFGLIPSIFLSEDPATNLRSYIGLYLDEEIRTEASVRQLSSFSRFLSIAALSNGQIINYSSIASDALEKRRVVHEYFEVLKDTLFGSELPAWNKSKKRKPLETSKFFLFDVGQRDLRGIKALQEENLLKRYIVVSLEDKPRLEGGVLILPWQDFLERLWSGELLD